MLAEFFLVKYGAEKNAAVTSLSPSAMQALVRYTWPGNVRELEHVIERAVALATHVILSVDDLPSEIRQKGRRGLDHRRVLPGTLSALQRERVFAVLESTHGNKEQAARLLGISRRTLYRLLDRYSLGKSQPHANSETFDPAQY